MNCDPVIVRRAIPSTCWRMAERTGGAASVAKTSNLAWQPGFVITTGEVVVTLTCVRVATTKTDKMFKLYFIVIEF